MNGSLHTGLHRSVRLERGATREQRAPRVVKHFHRRGLWGAWKNQRRARNEFAILAALSEAGHAVPRPFALRTPADAPREREVVMEWIPGSRPLSEVLEQVPRSGRSPQLAASVGQLLAELHASGLDSTDLHTGNFLVDAQQRLWAIDFHAARLAKRFHAARIVRDLVRLCAGMRERTSARFRARALRAWWLTTERRHATTDLDLQQLLGERWRLALEIERQARGVRRSVVAARSARFLRASRSCRPFQLPARGDQAQLLGFARPDATPAELAQLSQAVQQLTGDTQTAPAKAEELIEFELATPRRLLVALGSTRATRRAWTNAARLAEHGIACARPFACWTDRRRGVCVLELPEGSQCVEDPWASAASAAALGALWGRLADRGLSITGLHGAAVWQRDGVLHAGVVAELEDLLARPGSSRIHPAQDLHSPLSVAQGLASTLPRDGARAFMSAWRCEQGAGLWNQFSAAPPRPAVPPDPAHGAQA